MGLVREFQGTEAHPTLGFTLWPQWYPNRDRALLVHLLALMITFPLCRMPVQYILGEWDFRVSI